MTLLSSVRHKVSALFVATLIRSRVKHFVPDAQKIIPEPQYLVQAPAIVTFRLPIADFRPSPLCRHYAADRRFLYVPSFHTALASYCPRPWPGLGRLCAALARDMTAPLWRMARASGLVLIHPDRHRRQQNHQTFHLTSRS